MRWGVHLIIYHLLQRTSSRLMSIQWEDDILHLLLKFAGVGDGTCWVGKLVCRVNPQPPTPLILGQSPSPRNSEKPKCDQDDYCCPKKNLIHQQVHGRCIIMRQQSLMDSTLLWEMIIAHKEFEVNLSFKLNRNLAENKVNGGIWK